MRALRAVTPSSGRGSPDRLPPHGVLLKRGPDGPLGEDPAEHQHHDLAAKCPALRYAHHPAGGFRERHPSPLNPMQRVIERVRKLPQVVIGKLAGIARGGAAEFLSALDMRFAGKTRGKLAQMEVLTGIIPRSGATVYLPLLFGRARTLEVILGADLFVAELAERCGWINRALPDDALDAFVTTLARRIAGLAPGVIAAAKAAVDAGAPGMLDALKAQNDHLGEIFARPAAARLTKAALAAGAQTREGERDLEALLSGLAA